MLCEVCGIGERDERLVRYTLAIGDRITVIDHVPALVCPHCGETSFRPDVVETLQTIAWSKRTPARVLETPVFEFAS